MSATTTQGMLYIHSSPAALCPHIEWAINAALGKEIFFRWDKQTAEPGTLRAEIQWSASAGTGPQLASALRKMGKIRYEITEQASPGHDAGRWSHTPALGIFYATTDVHGNIMVSEDRIRYAYELGNQEKDSMRVYQELSLALGEAWDDELDPFRHATAGAQIRWLTQTG